MKLSTLLAGTLLAAAAAMPALAEQAKQTIYTAVLSGPNEEPSNGSPGSGMATVTIDFDANTMRVQENFTGLLAGVTASHIHCCTSEPGAGIAGVATTTPTFTDFPSGVTSGTYDHIFDMTDASTALVEGLDSGHAYANIHSTMFPGGEIRGFLAPIPEPEAYAMLLAGLAVVSMVARRRA